MANQTKKLKNAIVTGFKRNMTKAAILLTLLQTNVSAIKEYNIPERQVNKEKQEAIDNIEFLQNMLERINNIDAEKDRKDLIKKFNKVLEEVIMFITDELLVMINNGQYQEANERLKPLERVANKINDSKTIELIQQIRREICLKLLEEIRNLQTTKINRGILDIQIQKLKSILDGLSQTDKYYVLGQLNEIENTYKLTQEQKQQIDKNIQVQSDFQLMPELTKPIFVRIGKKEYVVMTGISPDMQTASNKAAMLINHFANKNNIPLKTGSISREVGRDGKLFQVTYYHEILN